ncbi:hypothetical protein FRACYDRAFT_244077 [Fragilariopsis cylindrus CCMP1102]|uniref:FAS1 domain-containing protein n=1 Tax=Fragilariopsis cylindrus CCMP1102 TaxID=635003 RepID=A0A1E7F3P4_9STRA|nr:hypothetical protein FRACYDRAFT_244077 [Fragilariopsis cylindrus CCMP1102]|eukprot:OEU12802.1 hypothetical protein FRACYDRAFT_244077 [Fragilariopsis cylindrus CCMP1102]
MRMLISLLLITALIGFDPVTAQPLQPPQLQLRRGASASSGSDTTTRSLQQEEENDRRSLATIGGGNDVNGVNADGSSNSNNNPNLPSGNSDCTRSNPDCTKSPIPIPVLDTTVTTATEEEGEGEGDEGEGEGEGVDTCGGIIETICSTNELETLCTLLDMLEEESSLDFLLNVGTFFAPTNRAFNSLAQSPPIFADLLEDVDILLNVMKYHAVNPTNANDANATNNNSTGTLLFYDELECNDQIIMVNQETTRTLCMNINTNNGDENDEEQETKVQLGIGNMPMRTLPKIIFNDNDSDSSANSESEIITCDGTAIIHLVDQVILPSLPLSSGNENGGSLIIVIPEEVEEEAMIEGGIVGDDDDDGFPADGSSNATNSSDVDDDEVAVSVVTVTTTTLAPATTPVVAAVCPLNPEFNGPCRTVGDICDYDHLYTGCTWGDLQCTPVISCECFSDETWQCLIAASVQCNDGIGGRSMMFEFENEPVAEAAAAVAATNTSTTTIPDGLPWGDRCDPSDDLPQAQPDTIVPVEVEGRLNGECPESGPHFGSCSDEYVPNLICEYDYIYTGCSWDELSCGSFNDGDWACRSFSMFPCNAQTTPDDLPWGQSCDPSSPLPEEPDQQQQEQQRRPSSSMRDIP